MRLLLTLVIVGVLPFLVRAVKNRRINCILLICYTIVVLIITLGSRSFENETHVGWNPIAVYQRAIQSVIQGWKTGGLRCRERILLLTPYAYIGGKRRKHRRHKALRRFASPYPGYRHGTPKPRISCFLCILPKKRPQISAVLTAQIALRVPL